MTIELLDFPEHRSMLVSVGLRFATMNSFQDFRHIHWHANGPKGAPREENSLAAASAHRQTCIDPKSRQMGLLLRRGLFL